MRWILIFCAVWMAVPVAAQEWVSVNEGWVEPYKPHVLALTRTVEGSVLAGTLDDGAYRDRAGYLYAGTNHGVFRSVAPLPVSSETGGERPPSLTLAPSYPNPSAGARSVPITLPETGPVSVTVRDVLGRRVATLVDAVLPAGEHPATWDASGAASGVYLVTLRAGQHVVTQRITVAR